MDTTMTILYGIAYGIAIALVWICIIELVNRYYEKKKIEKEALKDKKAKKQLEEAKALLLKDKIRKLPRKIKLKKIHLYVVAGNFVKRFKAKFNPLTNIAKFKGVEVFIDPKHITIINGKPSAFVDIDKRRSIDPPYVEPSLDTAKQQIATQILTWYYSLSGLRKRERIEIFAYIVIIIALVLVAFFYYTYTTNITKMVEDFTKTIQELQKAPSPLPSPTQIPT
ncbi:MAG: hypothetical protein DRO40_06685 [Thermoprotei archaeon]|nr:MAG: hypothetical protein DRO40_06685 [Thermoprotei archaeon]